MNSDIALSCDISFRVQFNVEFPRQVMNFPIEPRLLFGKRMPCLFVFETFVYLRLITFLQRKSTVSLALVSVVTYRGSCFNSPLKRKAAVLHPTVHFVSSTCRTRTFIWARECLACLLLKRLSLVILHLFQGF